MLAATGAMTVANNAVAAEWKSIGIGQYTDDIIASSFKNVDCQTMEVEFEQNTENPSHYRIVNPYAKWHNKFTKNFIYDDTKDYYLEFEVIDDKYVYVHPFSTGYTYENPAGGEVTARNQANEQVDRGRTIRDLAANDPTCLALYGKGNISYPLQFIYDGMGYDNIIVYFSRDTSSWQVGNKHDMFSIVMPGATPPDPNEGWESLGIGTMTDDVFSTLYENLPAQTWNVEIQRNIDDPDILRVVSPYKGWKDPGNLNLSYCAPRHDYMIIHTEHAPHAWIENFSTGYTYIGSGEITVMMQVATAINQYGYEAVAEAYPDAIFGRFEDNTFTIPEETFIVDGSMSDVVVAFIGQSFMPVNMHRGFKVTLPDPSGIDEADITPSGATRETEYFNLQGIPLKNPQPGSIVIMRNGNDVRKVVI